jgi:hypothetical protein
MIEIVYKKVLNMFPQITKNCVYIGIFLFILLIGVPYIIAGLSEVVALIFIFPFSAIAALFLLLWRIPLLANLQTHSPTLSLILKAFTIGIVLVAFFSFISVVSIQPSF